MRKNLSPFKDHQVFLNYPFDEDFSPLADAMNFAVVAGGLLPVCARDLTTPDHPRLGLLVDAIRSCLYSAHDLSRGKGQGSGNFARMNMPLEMGMALFHALDTQHREHRCLFFVETSFDYQRFASDLAGLDPKCHEGDEEQAIRCLYDWLRAVVPSQLFNAVPTVDVVTRYIEFKTRRATVLGGAADGKPSHEESREIMYEVCTEAEWWDWRSTRQGRDQFPKTPLSYRE